jgi:hypothetical protein
MGGAPLLFLFAGLPAGGRQTPDGTDTEAVPFAHGLARREDKSPFLPLIHKGDSHLPHQLVGLGAHDELQAVNFLSQIGSANSVDAEAQGHVAAPGGVEIDANRAFSARNDLMA